VRNRSWLVPMAAAATIWLAPLPALTQVVSPAASQEAITRQLRVTRDDGTSLELVIRDDRGYAVISDTGLIRLGWEVEVTPDGITARYEGHKVSLRPGTPFFQWDEDLLQLVRPPYSEDDGTTWLPVQFFLDFLPVRIPERYAVSPQGDLAVTTGVVIVSEQNAVEVPEAEMAPASSRVADSTPARPVRDEPRRTPEESASPAGEADPTWGLVVIDPGHGGRDPGAIGQGGRREKDIALSIGRSLARELGHREGLEVRLTRDRDLLVPLWERGHLATEWKRDRPAIFISIHANSLPTRSSVRGFETYFLSEARTEHEARVAENENAPLALRDDDAAETEEAPGLDFILRELRNRDHLRWSSVLAEEVQRGMEAVHPGPNRGVKQAPFAVITNALMPAVLIEVGFVTNPKEERVLSRGEFQRELAGAIAAAVDRFFERYPRAGASSGNRP
jgi:N-acetylmuramoyl-L-alanine amidase